MKLAGERRAVAALMFAFWFVMYLMNALLGGGPLAKLLYGMAGVYGLAFFSLVAGYFWARWYSVGVSLFGVIVAGIGLWQMGPEFQVLFIGITHLTATIALWGASMSELYDGQQAWREKFHMDEHAVQRLGRSVIRAGVSLPMVLIYGLAEAAGRDGAVARRVRARGVRPARARQDAYVGRARDRRCRRFDVVAQRRTADVGQSAPRTAGLPSPARCSCSRRGRGPSR